MSNNKQNSIDWLVEKLGRYNEEIVFLYQNEIEQAKAMHKEESIDTYIDGMFKGQELYLSEHKIKLDINTLNYCVKVGEQYYNETYGNTNSN